MKLAEALQERADLNRTIQQLKERLDNNVLVPDGSHQPHQLPDLRGGKELDRADCTQGCAVPQATRL